MSKKAGLNEGVDKGGSGGFEVDIEDWHEELDVGGFEEEWGG